MRVGVLGLGFMGSTHLQAWAKVPEAQVMAVMSRNEKRLSGDLSDVGGNLSIPGAGMDFSGYRKYRSVEQVLIDRDVDAVDICLPTYLHEEVATAALQHGKHVLVEKPMALDGAAAERVAAAAEKHTRVLMVAHVLRFFPEYAGLVELVRSGRLGRVRSAIFRRRTAVPTWGEWEFDRTKSGGGVFDLLIHDVDIALQLFGLPTAISAVGHENLRGGVDSITAQFFCREADAVTITGGWHHRGAYSFSMEYTVLADNGVVEFSSDGKPATVYWKDETSERLPAQDVDPFTAELSYFIECCQSGQQPLRCSPHDSALAVWAAKAMVDARGENGAKVEFRAQATGS
ncbi:MAG TPA: Gfo/Idh/MocA family oxidoreductase [Bryobacteraceae bacterium]|nr:Gfo/Idh/MocA family oxidoreductase [Bryobacteraceae bacterium]